MKASEWIDRVKTQRGWDSDYRVAKELDFKANTISMYRSGRGVMDESIAIKVAKALGTKPELILIDQLAERTKDDGAKEGLGKALKRLGGIAAGVMLATGMGGLPAPAEAQTVVQSSPLCIMSTRKRKKNDGAAAWLADQLRAMFTPAGLQPA